MTRVFKEFVGGRLSPSDRWVAEDHLAELDYQNKRIAAVEARIRQTIKDDPIIAQLLNLKGVGLVTAVTFRAEVGRVDRFQSGKNVRNSAESRPATPAAVPAKRTRA